MTGSVTKSGVQLLATQKPIKRPGWWKGKFALFWMLATMGEGRCLSKGRLPPHPQQSVGKSFYRRREGATCRNSTVSSDRPLDIGHRWSDLHLQLGHHVVNFFHLVGVSVSTRQLTGYGSEYYL